MLTWSFELSSVEEVALRSSVSANRSRKRVAPCVKSLFSQLEADNAMASEPLKSTLSALAIAKDVFAYS